MGSDTVLHITIGLIVAAATGVFTAGGFYIYVQFSIKQLQKDAADINVRLDQKIDKNYATLDTRITEVNREFQKDLTGIGGKVSDIGKTMYRHDKNFATAIMYAVEPEKEKEIVFLLKE